MQHFNQLAGAVIFLCPFMSMTNSVSAATGVPSITSFDPAAACREARADEETLRRDREPAVYEILVSREGGLQANGTATMIDDEGIFITAAHVVHFYKTKPLYVRYRYTERDGEEAVREFAVELITDTDDWESEDIVLLRALDWTNPPALAVPLRLESVNFVSGFFIGHLDGSSDRVFAPFSEYRKTAGGTYYRGDVFPHFSGALLLDQAGRAFALVVRHEDFSQVQLSALNFEQAFRGVHDRGQFSAFPLQRALDELMSIPPQAKVASLISKLHSGDFDDDDLGELQVRAASVSALDVLHLIDAMDPSSGSPPLEVSIAGDVFWTVAGLAAQRCVARYFFVRIAGWVFLLDPEEAPVIRGGALEGGDLVRFASSRSFSDMSGLTRYMVELGGEASDLSPDIQKGLATIGVTFARSAVSRPEFQNAVKRGEGNSGLAHVATNWALAEARADDFGVSNEGVVRAAIGQATRLGGTPAAYDLAANYAIADGDAASAAGLYWRAFASLGRTAELGIAHEEYAVTLSRSYGFAAQQSDIGNVPIDNFNPDVLLGMRGDSAWRHLAVTGFDESVVTEGLSDLYTHPPYSAM